MKVMKIIALVALGLCVVKSIIELDLTEAIAWALAFMWCGISLMK